MSRRTDNPHRHTVPNANYSSFPCYQEELKLKTNVRQCDNNDETQCNQHENFQLNVSMHDKLKMCFAEMETMKDQFDCRRRRLSSKKRSLKESTDPNRTKQATSSGSATRSQQPKDVHSKMTPDMSKGNLSNLSDGENKFTAHLVRTSSKDSMEATDKGVDLSKSYELLSHSPAYEETYVSPSGPSLPDSVFHLKSNFTRRAVSDPFGDWSPTRGRLDGNSKRSDKHTLYGERYPFESHSAAPFNWSDNVAKTRYDDLAQTKNAETRRSYDEWLQKLDEVNDISRSTLKRIKNLESEMTHLKNATDSLSCRQKSPKTFTSKIPIKSGISPISYGNVLLRNHLTKKHWDKSTNTDIDFKFMNELLSNWKSRTGALTANIADLPFIDEPSRPTRRRLTTTIGRSVEIQTETEQKSHQEKGISTEDWGMWQNQPVTPDNNLIQGLIVPRTSLANRDKNSSQMSILDMPNIETSQSNEAPIRSNVKTPEPIVEIYSDSEDTSFDDFEKNIYNQISRRALIKSRLINRKQRAQITNTDDELDHLKLRNSSTQTNDEREEPSTERPINELPNNVASGFPKKNLRSTSKIVIERVRMNQKEKSEIVLKTDIDKEGVVHRTTEVKNRKFKPKEPSRNASTFRPSNEHVHPKYLRKVNSDMNVCHSRNQFSRPLSAIDISNSELMKKKENHFMCDKALSSIDIAAKSPVISEGYHSEYLDSTNRINTPSQEYLIEPPKSFQSDSINKRNRHYSDWEEVSKSEVTNKMVNEAIDGYKEMGMGKGGFVTLTNETVIDNTGKQTNITTKSRTIRKYNSKDKTKSSLDLSNSNQDLENVNNDLNRSQSVSQFNLDHLNSPQPFNKNDDSTYFQPDHQFNQPTQSLVPRNAQCQPTMCNFSLIYNCDNNVVFRANFGLAKLPCFETNL